MVMATSLTLTAPGSLTDHQRWLSIEALSVTEHVSEENINKKN